MDIFHFSILLRYTVYIWASLVAQTVKNLPAMQETPVWFLDWEDPLEKGTATHSSILAWGIPWTQFFTSGGQSIGVSASASILPMNLQDWFPLGGTGWISLQSRRLSRVFSNTTVQKHQFFGTQLSSQSNSHIHPYLTTGKTIALTRRTLVGKVMSLLLNMLRIN